jgi:outer membrane protein OmpA-like peptidoglycan-associated protein
LTDTVVGKKVFEWVKISDTIEAKSNYKFMSIGNFIDDDDKTPQLIVEKGNSFPRSYYFIDDVMVIPLDEYVEPKTPKPSVVMGDVTFNTGEWKILPVAFPILDSLSRSFLKSPTDTIRLVGHTDNKGAAEMNQQLSINRAQAIKNYLIKKGIPQKQIIATGRGENEPISENETENGRKLNRRVEIFVKSIEPWTDKFDD